VRYNQETREVTMTVEQALAFVAALGGVFRMGGLRAMTTIGSAIVGVDGLSSDTAEEWERDCIEAGIGVANELADLLGDEIQEAHRRLIEKTSDVRGWGR